MHTYENTYHLANRQRIFYHGKEQKQWNTLKLNVLFFNPTFLNLLYHMTWISERFWKIRKNITVLKSLFLLTQQKICTEFDSTKFLWHTYSAKSNPSPKVLEKYWKTWILYLSLTLLNIVVDTFVLWKQKENRIS